MYRLGESIHKDSVEMVNRQKTSDKITNMGPRMSGNREGLKVTSRMAGGGSDPGADVTSRNKLTDGPTHRDPPEGISKKLEGRVGFQMAQRGEECAQTMPS